MKFLKCKPGDKKSSSGKKIGIVGGGVSGLSAAGELICSGHEVHIYDEMPESGGFLMFGISSHEISREGVKERINELKDAGAIFHQKTKVGKDIDLEELIKRFDAILISTGTWKMSDYRISGDDMEGVYNAIDFLKRYNLNELGYGEEDGRFTPLKTLPKLSGNVGVIIPKVSGGNVMVGGELIAMDVLPMLFVQGAEKATLIYKGSRLETRASESNFQYIEDYYFEYSPEKIEIMDFTEPLQLIGDNNKVKGVEAIKTRLDCERLERVENSEFTIKADSIIISNPPAPTPPFENGRYGIELNEDGTIKTNRFNRTNREKVFAAGNVNHGPWYIISATRSGIRAAKSIDKYLSTGKW